MACMKVDGHVDSHGVGSAWLSPSFASPMGTSLFSYRWKAEKISVCGSFVLGNMWTTDNITHAQP
jgi:hypothetical protein